MPRTLLLALSLLLGLSSVAAAQDFDAAGEAAMLDRINALRADQELAPLSRVDALDAVARAHSAEMARTRQLAHVSDATGTPEDRVRAAGVDAGRIAENVANHQATAGAQEALEASAPHQANMLDPNVTQVGLGSVRTEQGVFVTQVFTDSPAPAEAAPEAEAPVAPESPEATVEDEAPAADPFALIPPFVERAQEAAAPLLGAVSDADAEPADEAPTAAAPEAPATDAPAAPQASAPAASAGNLSPGAQSTLRELVGLAQGLLGGATAQ